MLLGFLILAFLFLYSVGLYVLNTANYAYVERTNGSMLAHVTAITGGANSTYPDLRGQLLTFFSQQLTSHSIILLTMLTALFTLFQVSEKKSTGGLRLPESFLLVISILLLSGVVLEAGRLTNYGELAYSAISMPFNPAHYHGNMTAYAGDLAAFAKGRSQFGIVITIFGGTTTLGLALSLFTGSWLAVEITKPQVTSDGKRDYLRYHWRILVSMWAAVISLSFAYAFDLTRPLLEQAARFLSTALQNRFVSLPYLVLLPTVGLYLVILLLFEGGYFGRKKD